MKVSVEVNGQSHEREVSPFRRVLDFLRQDLGLTGTKEGCSEGECGACTVLVDDRPACSCLMAVGQVHGHRITTVEGLADGDTLHAVQDALVRFGGAQCGICTPGIAVCAVHALAAEPHASRERMRELLAGNICRCTGYQLIVDALIDAAETLDGARSSAGAPIDAGDAGAEVDA
jgi:aerobic-type carbon monoxide dehydrogenase small subunit (CoxS/CutS family)